MSQQGTVIKSTGKWCTVKSDQGKLYECNIKGRFRMQEIQSTNPVAVGDRVIFDLVNGNKGVVTELEERRNYIIRKSANLSKQTHIIAANVDQAVLIITMASPETKIEFADRFLISAEAYRVPVLIVFNKTDLYNQEETDKMELLIDVYQKIGYECLKTSVPEKLNIEKLREKVVNRVSVFSGNSGVGKSTLINEIDTTLHLKTGDISDYHLSGKHITTFAEMFCLSQGGFIIDTPGIRGFGLYNFQKEELYHFFPEIFEAARNCRYHNCTHIHEPGCAVMEALENGTISNIRYLSYMNIFDDEEGKYR